MLPLEARFDHEQKDEGKRNKKENILITFLKLGLYSPEPCPVISHISYFKSRINLYEQLDSQHIQWTNPTKNASELLRKIFRIKLQYFCFSFC